MSSQTNQIKKQIKFAVVMYGGGSLAIYINGVAQELLKMAQATAGGSNRKTYGNGAQQKPSTDALYRKIAQIMSGALGDDFRNKSNKELKEALEKIDLDGDTKVEFVIDVLTGSSAGGINAVFLSKALVNNVSIERLQELWMKQGDFAVLLNDKKSIADNGLHLQGKPASLLNSQRMYLELLKAIDEMDAVRQNEAKSLVSELDLYVTYTDFRGVPESITGNLLERRHKQVFHFRYERNEEGGDDRDNDFKKPMNPFLAFAARSTSAFPVAFEPMQLADIDDIIRISQLPHPADSKAEKWKKYFHDVRDENGAPLDWTIRSFVDGGALDNKPFGYAIDKITERQATGIVERKLVFIDPFAEEFKPDDHTLKPNALVNLLGQGVGLPRYETIREDLKRLIARNRLIERVNEMTKRAAEDFEKFYPRSQPDDADNQKNKHNLPKWNERDTWDIYDIKGSAFMPYFRLRVSSVTDDIARLVAGSFEIDESSSYFPIMRALVKCWREQNYVESKKDGKTLNAFLADYDVEYRLRRLHFVIRQLEYLLRCFDQISEPQAADQKDATDNALANQRGVVSANAIFINSLSTDDAEKQVVIESLNRDKTVVIELQKELQKIYRRLREENEFLRVGLKNAQLVEEYKKASEKIDKREDAERLEKFRAKLKRVEIVLQNLEEKIKPAENRNEAETNNRNKTEPEINRAQLSKDALDRIARQVNLLRNSNNKNCETGRENCLETIGNVFGREQLDDIYDDKDAAKTTFYGALNNAANELQNYLSGDRMFFLKRASSDFENLIRAGRTPEEKFIRKYIENYYDLFESFDQISFPIYFETPVGEAVPVEIVRISSRDAHSLINEELKNETRRKLAGNVLYSFGAFLDPRWRLNDIMWGRLDAAERLIATLLPGEDFAAVREILEREANEIILNEMLLEKVGETFRGSLVTAFALAKTEASERDAIDRLVRDIQADTIQNKLTDILTNSFGRSELCKAVEDHYEVNRRLEPEPTMKLLSRATQIGGKMLENIADEQAQAKNPFSWIARFGSIFWGLVTVAAPNSIGNLLFFHWLKLIYLFEILLIVGGALLNSQQTQQFGIAALVITATINLVVLALQDYLRGRSFWKFLALALGSVIVLLAVIGGLLIYAFAFGVADNSFWEETGRQSQKFKEYPQLAKLFVALLPGFFILALWMWQTVRNREIAKFGWITLGLTGALTAVSVFFLFYLPGNSPMMAMASVESGAEAAKIVSGALSAGVVERVKNALIVDTFIFVPLYLIFFLLMAQLLAARRAFKHIAVWLAYAVAIVAISAAIADCFENYYIYRAFGSAPNLLQNGGYDWLIENLKIAMKIKWSAIFIATFLIALIFPRKPSSAQGFGEKYEKSGGAFLTAATIMLIAAPICGFAAVYGDRLPIISFFALLGLGAICGGISFLLYGRRFLVNH